MADDLTAMLDRIADELARSDLTSQIRLAVTDAIKVYQKERFRFSDITPSAPPTFNTVAGRYIYTSADNANIGSTLKIDNVNAVVGASLQPLVPDTPENIVLFNEASNNLGWPSRYSYEGNQLLLSPIPDTAYLIKLRLFMFVPAPASDGEAANPWMTDAELLIRSRAKYEIAVHVTRNASMAAAMSPDEPSGGQQPGASYRAWQMLKRETNRVTGNRRIRAMQF